MSYPDMAPTSMCSGLTSKQLQTCMHALPGKKRVRNSVFCEGMLKPKASKCLVQRSVGYGHSREPYSKAWFGGASWLAALLRAMKLSWNRVQETKAG